MSTYKVGVIAGDGIGPEVVAEALKVVDAAGVRLDLAEYDLSGARYLHTATLLPGEDQQPGIHCPPPRVHSASQV